MLILVPHLVQIYVYDTFSSFDNENLSSTYLNHFENGSEMVQRGFHHFEILSTGKSDLHCTIKETPLISDSLNENVGSEKPFLHQSPPEVSIPLLFFSLSPVPFCYSYNRHF